MIRFIIFTLCYLFYDAFSISDSVVLNVRHVI